MLRIRHIHILLTLIAGIVGSTTCFGRQPATAHPDFAKIRTETLNPDSPYYYPKLLKSFLSPDTTMTDDDYRYFYYGTMFQEDYNPYRPNPFAAEVKAIQPVYQKNGTLSRSEKRQIESLALKSLYNNPLDLMQLMYLVYAYEQQQKSNLARIWKHKLDHLLLTISRSGTGANAELALVVVYPTHEFEYFNLSNIEVISQDYEPPYYEVVTIRTPGATDNRKYWFDLHHVLEQYYLKHPSEDQD